MMPSTGDSEARAWAQAVALSRRTWLVTGAAGFVGSHIVRELVGLRQRVVGLDNLSTGRPSNLDWVQSEVTEGEWAQFSFLEGDIRDFDTCQSAVRGVDIVLHQAALGSVQRSLRVPLETNSVNVNGTLNVFMASLESGVSKVVYASSSSVYGDSPDLPKVEERIGRPLSPYAVSKRVAELYAETLSRSHALPAVGLRYFNVVGARQDPNGPYAAVVPRWAMALRSGRPPTIYGDGRTSRDFCPVENVVQANVIAALSDDATNGEIYNVALGGETTLSELLQLIRDLLSAAGVSSAYNAEIREASKPGDIRHSVADIGKAVRELGYSPEVGLLKGLTGAIGA